MAKKPSPHTPPTFLRHRRASTQTPQHKPPQGSCSCHAAYTPATLQQHPSLTQHCRALISQPPERATLSNWHSFLHQKSDSTLWRHWLEPACGCCQLSPGQDLLLSQPFTLFHFINVLLTVKRTSPSENHFKYLPSSALTFSRQKRKGTGESGPVPHLRSLVIQNEATVS